VSPRGRGPAAVGRAALVAGLSASLVALLVSAGPAVGQAMGEGRDQYRSAMEATAEALELLEARGLDAAVPVLEETLETCWTGPTGADCRRVTLYALGYAYQTAAAARPGARDSLLDRAIDYLQRVRRENPEFAPADRALALAYRQMGAREWQEGDLQALAAADTTGRYMLLLGDYYRDREMPDRARDHYLRAMELDPDAPEPRDKLLALYRQGQLPARELVPLIDRWALRFPGLAAEGYQVAMRRTYPDSWSDAAEVLPRWLGTQRALDQLGPGLVKQVPEDWGAEPFAGLRAFLLDPLEADVPTWWEADNPRREALADLARALGHWRLAEDEPLEAVRVWQRGRAIAPSGSATWIEITSDLALLLDEAPELDPDGERFLELERELFERKGEAIASRDLAAMRRFHGTLGVIYARRGRWGADGSPRGALFQLRNAVAAAAARSKETGVSEPVPELHRLLAETYGAIGQREPGAAARVDAALAYLELDGLDAAGAMLDSARVAGLRAVPREARRAGEVARWLEWRRAAVDASRRERPCPPALLDGVRSAEPGSGLTATTVARQRFRVLAACAAGAGRAGAGLYAEAVDGLLTSGVPLLGIGDLTRLELARETVFRSFGQEVGRLQPTGETPGALRLAVSPGDDPVFIVPGAATLTAARVALETEPWTTAVRLRVDGTSVQVLDAGALQADELTRRLEGVRGVDQVRERRFRYRQP
jgi:tetratricopeptide (TPR) repeat protein